MELKCLLLYGISIFVTVFGTIISVLVTAMLAYPMSRKNFKYKNVLSFFVFITMLFNGGIVASYIMWSSIFHIKDTVWALMLPNYLVTAFNVFLVRNYYANNIPDALIESAQIDGATELRIFWRIILPLSVPTVATISLFTGLCYWNDWVNGLYYIRDAQYYGIQNLLIKIMNNIEFLKSGSANLLGTGNMNLPGSSVRMAMAVIGILPILIIYPFVQKYFIKGVVVGAVKG
jgi:putative aldouronate transport system permease protein